MHLHDDPPITPTNCNLCDKPQSKLAFVPISGETGFYLCKECMLHYNSFIGFMKILTGYKAP